MKAIKLSAILFSAIILLGLTSCERCSTKKQQPDTHVHEDGTVHGNHAHEADECCADQESFKTEADPADTAKTHAPEHKHGADCDHNHDHSGHDHAGEHKH